MNNVPVIDITPFRDGSAKRSVAAAVNHACVDNGFFSIVGHGVPEPLTQATRQAAADFFALPFAAKAASVPAKRAPRGSPTRNALARLHPRRRRGAARSAGELRDRAARAG